MEREEDEGGTVGETFTDYVSAYYLCYQNIAVSCISVNLLSSEMLHNRCNSLMEPRYANVIMF